MRILVIDTEVNKLFEFKSIKDNKVIMWNKEYGYVNQSLDKSIIFPENLDLFKTMSRFRKNKKPQGELVISLEKKLKEKNGTNI